DGIRDRTVTGVQTCALPISLLRASFRRRQTPPRDARAGRCSLRTAALEPVLPHRRYQERDQPAGHDRRRRQAAAVVVAVWRGPCCAVVIRSHLAVGARLRRRRTASRFAAEDVALADETARTRR